MVRQRPQLFSVAAIAWLVGLGLAVEGFAQTPESTQRAERGALAALEAYMETWNTRKPEVWAASLHFPHVRPSARPFRLSRSPDEFTSTVNFERTVATGWHRSQWDSFRVLHVSESKVHVAGQYTRYAREGTPILTALVTYVVTHKDGRWGTQARFGAGRMGLTTEERDANAAAAEDAVATYVDAMNDPTNVDGWADTMHYPQVRIARGTLQQWETDVSFKAGSEPGRLRTWFRTRLVSFDAVQVGQDAVNAAVQYSFENSDGESLATHDAVFLVTRRDGIWKIQARSSM